jgi:SAM-dependent methyltransferase
MSVDLGAARRALASYRGTSLGTRAFVVARYVVAPMGPLADELHGLRGDVLSLGSGLTMLERYFAELEPGLRFDGIDLDPVKVRLLAKTHRRSPRVTLELGDATEVDRPGRYDVVLVCDALHHFPAERHADVARSVAEALRPGGIALVKDLDVRPRWKYHWNRVHDRVVAGPDPIWCRSPHDMAALFAEAGLEVERAERIEHRLTPYAHYLIRARKPAG